MLADGAGVIGDDDIAFEQFVVAVKLKPVLNRRAHHVGDEDRHARGALADQVAIRIDDADGIVLVFVDIRAESGAGDVDVDLVGDGDEAAPDHFDGDRIDRRASGVPRAGGINGGSQW
jgi:hypothetical protein